jgi:phage protein U
MFAVLGEITFQVLTGPETIESSRSFDYAEHQVIEDRPRLQWLAAGLETLAIELMFHASFANPSGQLAALAAAAEDHNARALVFGNGEHRGYFVVTSMRTVSTQMTAAGDVIAITVRAMLKEWAFGIEADPSAPPLAPFQVIGIVPAPAGTGTGPIQYSGPTGLGLAVTSATAVYVPPAIAAPGVSPILNNPPSGEASPPAVMPSDVAPNAIVRGAL